MPAFRSLYRHRLFRSADTDASLPSLNVYLAEGHTPYTPPAKVLPPPSPRKCRMRRGIAEWLVEWLAEETPTIVGIDHGFSCPLRYLRASCPWPLHHPLSRAVMPSRLYP